MFAFLRRFKAGSTSTTNTSNTNISNHDNKPLSIDMLTESSPRLAAPSCVKVPLWKHQEAMLQRCVDIELNSDKKLTMLPTNHLRYKPESRPEPIEINIGIMNDPPGCGKTYVALSLMARDPTSTNIVIVPSNIHKQWTDAIKTFISKDNFKYATITEYKDTLDINKRIKNANCIITTTLYCELVVSGLSQNTKIKRVFVDEIDTVGDTRIASVPPCDIVWFMSASFDPVADREIGPFNLAKLTEPEVLRRICKCDVKFMQYCQPTLVEPRFRMITVPDGDITIFKGLVDERSITLLNALNLHKAKHQLLNRLYESSVTNAVDLAHVKVKELGLEIEQLHKDIEDIEANAENSKIEGGDEIPEYVTESLKAEANKKINEKTALLNDLNKNIDSYKPNDEANPRTKLDEFESICAEIAESTHKQQASQKPQWLFFSDDDHIFDLITPIMKAKSITYTSLDQGTQEKNEAVLKKYKSGEVTTLLVNSIQDGVGLNLENTTHIVFLHYTNPKMIDQVVCRAQRPGRTNQLEIVCIYHENEAPCQMA